jgi:hypothetical protein
MKSLDPLQLDPAAPAYKDWYHLNLFDHGSGSIGLLNVSLHGALADPRARVVGTALLHVPDQGWHGNVMIAGLDEAVARFDGVFLKNMAIALDPTGQTLHASATLKDENLAISLKAVPAVSPVRFQPPQPFGSGWIAWFVAPRMTLDGTLRIGSDAADLASFTGYHDHNWGRWFWGEDIGWEWGVMTAGSEGPTFIWARVTDRSHRRVAPAHLIVVHGRQLTRFPPGSITIHLEDRLEGASCRLPGALAALHADRARPILPARVQIEARAGLNWVRLAFEAEAAAQLIEGEPMRPGYSFIHELVGDFVAVGHVHDADVESHGLGIFEYVC